jgi:hypothetical protein
MEPVAAVVATEALRAEKLTLLVADSKSGYFGVYRGKPGLSKPYRAEVKRGGKDAYLGVFATAEEAALCVARTPEGRAVAAERAAAAAPLTSEEARQLGSGQDFFRAPLQIFFFIFRGLGWIFSVIFFPPDIYI